MFLVLSGKVDDEYGGFVVGIDALGVMKISKVLALLEKSNPWYSPIRASYEKGTVFSTMGACNIS